MKLVFVSTGQWDLESDDGAHLGLIYTTGGQFEVWSKGVLNKEEIDGHKFATLEDAERALTVYSIKQRMEEAS